MPMNGDILGTEIVAQMDIALAANPTASEAQRLDLWKAIGRAIVLHIQANALVSSTVVVASVSGVTTGPGVSGPGAGTATGTVA